MRILFLNDLCDPRIGSSIRLMYQEAQELRSRGHETAVISTTKDRSEVGPCTLAGSEVWRLHSDYPQRFRPLVAMNNRGVVAGVRKILAEWKPDVVHSHLVHSNLSYASLSAARQTGAGVVFTAHDSMTYCYQKLDCFHGGEQHEWAKKEYGAHWSKCIPCQRLRYLPGRNWAIRRVLERDVDRFTVVSDELGVAVRTNGIRVDRTIHNAIRLQPQLPSRDELSEFRERLGLTGKQVIAMGGRLHELKGIKQLFSMLAILRKEFGDLRLLVLGRKEDYRCFEPDARAAGVEDIVVPTGWLEGNELLCAYGTLDVMVAPSICFETFGMLGLEAMEFEKPVVVTSFGGCHEVVEHGKWGFVANPYRIEEFAGRIAELLRDGELRARMGRAGRARLEQHFSIGRMTDEYFEEYELAASLAKR